MGGAPKEMCIRDSDFLSGMMSERNDGKSISEVVGLYMGKVITFIMRVFSVVLLVMVGVNFSVGPAGLLAKLTPDMLGTCLLYTSRGFHPPGRDPPHPRGRWKSRSNLSPARYPPPLHTSAP